MQISAITDKTGADSCKVFLLKLRYNYKSSVGVLVDTNTQKECPSSPHIGWHGRSIILDLHAFPEFIWVEVHIWRVTKIEHGVNTGKTPQGKSNCRGDGTAC